MRSSNAPSATNQQQRRERQRALPLCHNRQSATRTAADDRHAADARLYHTLRHHTIHIARPRPGARLDSGPQYTRRRFSAASASAKGGSKYCCSGFHPLGYAQRGTAAQNKPHQEGTSNKSRAARCAALWQTITSMEYSTASRGPGSPVVEGRGIAAIAAACTRRCDTRCTAHNHNAFWQLSTRHSAPDAARPAVLMKASTG